VPRRPNIVFILSDQQRWDTISAYGSPIIPGLTPSLDRLAARGALFRHAFSCQPVCGPARSCLQTGLYATQTGCFTNARSLPVDQVTIAKLLSSAGYETAYVGKWHLATDATDHRAAFLPVPPERRGGYRDFWLASDVLEFTSHGYEGYLFDTQGNRVDFEGYRPDAMTSYVLDYLRDYATRNPRAATRHNDNSNERPFFLFTSFIEPHHQNDLNRYIGPIGSKERFKRYHTPGDLVGTEGDWRLHMPDYLGCCWSLDQNVGRIVAQLEQLGLLDNTLIIYTSDHGSHFCTRNREYKRSCHDNSIRVPLIAAGPGFSEAREGVGGAVIDELVSLIDLPATVVRAAGVDTPASFRGRPLHDLLRSSSAAPVAASWRDDVFVQISESQTGRAVRTARWKYGVTAEDEKAAARLGRADRYVEQYLYDLAADPHERNNLVAQPDLATIRAELAQRLLRRMADAQEPSATIVPATTVAAS